MKKIYMQKLLSVFKSDGVAGKVAKYYTVFVALLLAATVSVVAQTTTITGVLKNKKSKEAVAFAHVMVNDSKHGTVSDINGKFTLKTSMAVDYLTIKCMGYKTATRTIGKNSDRDLVIYLEEDVKNLPEVVIKPGINPADRIVQAVIDNRKQNNFQNLKSYKYISHNRGAVEMTFACSDKEAEKIKERLRTDTSSIFDEDVLMMMDSTYLFFTESINEYKYRKPDKVAEIMLATRSTGSKNPLFSLVLTQMQSASFYKNFITIMGTRFVNPFSKNTFSRYYFEIQDTIFEGNDTIFGISFRPLARTKFNGLHGKAYINTDRYALQNITAQAIMGNMMSMSALAINVEADSSALTLSSGKAGNSNANIDSITQIRIRHSYARDTANRWFPEQYRFEWDLLLSPKDKIVIRFFTQNDIKDVEVNAKIKRKEFSDVVLDVDIDASEKDEEFWLKHRGQVSDKENNTFIFYDSLSRVIAEDTTASKLFSKLSVDKLMTISRTLASGKLPIYWVNIDLNKLYNYNIYERSRWGFGLETNERLCRYASIGGYFGYGVGDKAWKYGGRLNFYFDRYKNYNLGFSFSQDLEKAAMLNFNSYNIVNINNNYSYTFSRYQNVRKLQMYYSMPLVRYTTAKLTLSYSHEHNMYADGQLLYFYNFQDVEKMAMNKFAEASFMLEWNYKQQRIRTADFEFVTNSSASYPMLKALFTRGFSFLDANNEFNRIELEYRQNINVNNNGLLSIYTTAGHVSENAPYSRMFTTIGTKNIPYYFHNTFLTLHPYSYTSTNYVNVCTHYKWNKVFWNTSFSKPSLAFQLNGIIGTADIEKSVDGITINAPEKGILEAMVCIHDLLISGYTSMGICYAYRISSYNDSNPLNNMALVLTLGASF
ncbi:MAG: carboxypeptidase-like regulatory domain-containing protein [Bacteroidales bacterium]|nr:carboxypeptidase-like regulatory domain-containing protein [Bacteroidales bacterium]